MELIQTIVVVTRNVEIDEALAIQRLVLNFVHLYALLSFLSLYSLYTIDNMQVSRLKDAMSQIYWQLEVHLPCHEPNTRNA